MIIVCIMWLLCRTMSCDQTGVACSVKWRKKSFSANLAPMGTNAKRMPLKITKSPPVKTLSCHFFTLRSTGGGGGGGAFAPLSYANVNCVKQLTWRFRYITNNFAIIFAYRYFGDFGLGAEIREGLLLWFLSCFLYYK